jgi:probable HAF family extracellular repeat protein
MALVDRTSIRRRRMAAIATGVFTALALANSGLAWGQDTGDGGGASAASPAEVMAPAGMMQMMMGAPSDDSAAAPLTGHGFLLDKGVFTTIDHPDAVAETGATSINNRGQIVGGYIDAEGTTRGFLLDKGVFTTIDHPDAVAETGATSINNRGQIVGGYIDAEGTTRGFLLDDGAFTPIDHPDAASGPGAGTVARDINKRGQIVGFYLDAEGTAHGFLRDKEGVFTPIDHPDAPQKPIAGTAVYGINDHGQIVGFHFDVAAESTRGFLLGSHDDPSAEGVFTAIDVPGAIDTLPSAIDNRGQIVGGYSDAGGTAHGFVRDKSGTFRTIDHPDAASGPDVGTLPSGVNNRGQVVGQYVDADLRCHGFLLSRGALTTIDDPDALSTTGASDINDRSQIVGFRDGGTGLGGCAPPVATSASDPGSTDN